MSGKIPVSNTRLNMCKRESCIASPASLISLFVILSNPGALFSLIIILPIVMLAKHACFAAKRTRFVSQTCFECKTTRKKAYNWMLKLDHLFLYKSRFSFIVRFVKPCKKLPN